MKWLQPGRGFDVYVCKGLSQGLAYNCRFQLRVALVSWDDCSPSSHL